MIWRIPLDDPDEGRQRHPPCGCIVAADGCLRVVHRGFLRSITPEGRVLWRRSLKLGGRRFATCSLPLALDDGSVVLTSNRRLLRERGGRLEVLARDELGDDSGVSPNLDYKGSIFCGGFDRLSRVGLGEVSIVDDFGYDILPPAVYPDGSLALASYYGSGLCRRRPNGELVWSTRAESREQDGLVTLNRKGDAACACLNDHSSLVCDPEGKVLWRLKQPALFSACPSLDDGWLALSDGMLARVLGDGTPLWSRELAYGRHSWCRQAIVDDWGFIYVPTVKGFEAYDPRGELLFGTELPNGQSSPLCPCSHGKMAFIHDGWLLMVGQ